MPMFQMYATREAARKCVTNEIIPRSKDCDVVEAFEAVSTTIVALPEGTSHND